MEYNGTMSLLLNKTANYIYLTTGLVQFLHVGHDNSDTRNRVL